MYKENELIKETLNKEFKTEVLVESQTSMELCINDYLFGISHETCSCHGFRLSISCRLLRFEERLETRYIPKGYTIETEYLYIIEEKLLEVVKSALNLHWMSYNTEHSNPTYHVGSSWEDVLLAVLNTLPIEYDIFSHKSGCNPNNAFERLKSLEIGTRFQYPNVKCYEIYKGFEGKENSGLEVIMENQDGVKYSLIVTPYEQDNAYKGASEYIENRKWLNATNDTEKFPKSIISPNFIKALNAWTSSTDKFNDSCVKKHLTRKQLIKECAKKIEVCPGSEVARDAVLLLDKIHVDAIETVYLMSGADIVLKSTPQSTLELIFNRFCVSRNWNPEYYSAFQEYINFIKQYIKENKNGSQF